MRKLIITLLSGLAISSIAQNREIDSLRQLLSKCTNDTSRAYLLIQMGTSYVNSIPDSCYYYFNKGMQVAQTIQDPKEKAICLSSIAATLSFIGNFPEALNLSLKSLKLAEQIKDPLANYSTFGALGLVYYSLNEFKKSLEYFLKALREAENLQDKIKEEKSLTNIGDVYLMLNRLDSALYYSNLAYLKSIANKNNIAVADELNNIGDIYMRLNNSSLSLEYYRTAILVAIETKNYDNFCQGAMGIAGIFQKQNRNDSALVYGYRTLTIAIANNLNFRQQDASNLIASVYETEKKSDSAFKYLKLSIALKDSLFNLEKSKSFQNMTFEENIRQQELAEEKKKAEENTIRNLQLLAIGVFIPIFFLFVLFLSRTKVKARVVEFLGIVSLLLLFEFITDLIYPYVSVWTNENPLWEMLILVILAAFLEPLNHRLEHWVKAKLVHRPVKVLPSLVIPN